MPTREELRKKIYDYVMESEHRLEIFTDYEICTEEDYTDCVAELDNLLSDMDTSSMRIIADRIDHDEDFSSYYEMFYV